VRNAIVISYIGMQNVSEK